MTSLKHRRAPTAGEKAADLPFFKRLKGLGISDAGRPALFSKIREYEEIVRGGAGGILSALESIKGNDPRETEGVLEFVKLIFDAKRAHIFGAVIEKLTEVLVDIELNDSYSREGETLWSGEVFSRYDRSTTTETVKESIRPNRELARYLLKQILSEFSLGGGLTKKASDAVKAFGREKEKQRWNEKVRIRNLEHRSPKK